MIPKAALVMAGGRGERFWPKSRKNLPKQFLCLMDTNRTMLQSTVERILPLIKIEDIFIATNRDYKSLVKEQLPDLPEENILCEPTAKNTAPCIGWGAVAIQKKYGDALMLVLPSDHQIMQPHLFRSVLKNALHVADTMDALVTLGISPTMPDTGYGYIQYEPEQHDLPSGVFRVKRFVEKPDLETARSYLSSGEYLWNSGMFIWKASTILKEMETYLPENAKLLTQIGEAMGTSEQDKVVECCFEQMKAISIDYGIMEKSRKVFVLPSSFGWDDVGSWLAVERMNTPNDAGNVIKGDVITVDTRRCIVQGDERTIAMIGLEDIIIVDTEDALLVCAKDSASEIKKVVEILRAVNRTELL